MNEREFQDLMAYQNLLSRQVAQQAKTDRKIKFLQLVAKLGGATRKKIQTAALIHDAETHGFTTDEAYAILEGMEHDGLLAKAGEGYIKQA